MTLGTRTCGWLRHCRLHIRHIAEYPVLRGTTRAFRVLPYLVEALFLQYGSRLVFLYPSRTSLPLGLKFKRERGVRGHQSLGRIRG